MAKPLNDEVDQKIPRQDHSGEDDAFHELDQELDMFLGLDRCHIQNGEENTQTKEVNARPNSRDKYIGRHECEAKDAQEIKDAYGSRYHRISVRGSLDSQRSQRTEAHGRCEEWESKMHNADS